VKDFRNKYDDVKVLKLSNIQKFILKYIQNLNYTLADLKQIKIILSAVKSIFYMAELRIVEYVYDIKRRHFDSAKVLKILK
jgi:hypothetical protein